MTEFRSFVTGLVKALNDARSMVVQVSSAELAVSEKYQMVELFFRTRPALTEAMFSVQPFEYPVFMLTNTALYSWWASGYIQQGSVVPAPSELFRAALLGVPSGNFYGSMLDEERAIWSVPAVATIGMEEDDEISPAKQWAAAIFNQSIPGVPGANREGIQFRVMHLPDTDICELSDWQMMRLTQLTLGWNYCGVYSEAQVKQLVELLGQTHQIAHTVTRY